MVHSGSQTRPGTGTFHPVAIKAGNETAEASGAEGEGASAKRKRKKQRRTGRLAMSLTTPPSVQRLQTALHDKAVTFFHALSGLYSVIAPTTSAVFSPRS